MDKVIVGLGNPGSRYEGTRHNLGWMVVDRLAERAGATGRSRARDRAASVRGRLADLELLLVKPTTYMNLSGSAVRAVLARERVPIRDLLVVVDDFALPFGRLRIRERGSDGGHNGLRSIIGELGTQGFSRLRVGIGEPARGTAIHHVLADFGPREQARLDDVLDAAADCVIDWAKDGVDRAAARWNGWRLEPGEDEDGEAKAHGSGARTERIPTAGGLRPGSLDGSTQERPAPSEPDADGIVRTTTGWRRLLRLAGHDRSEPESGTSER